MLRALLLAGAAWAADADGSGVKIQQLYDQAFKLYAEGSYAEAIQAWEDILRQDPNQKSARQLIKEAQEEARRKNAGRLGDVRGLVRKGRYRAALSRLDELIDAGAPVAGAEALRAELEPLARVVPELPTRGKAWAAAAKGLRAALEPPLDLKLAFNALRHARDLEPGEARLAGLLDWFSARHPEAAADPVTPGMTLLEYKRSIALNHIYAENYHAAVSALEEALALEPDDLVCLQRLGTAYYSLKLYDKARSAWERALKLAPADAALAKFLKKLPAVTGGGRGGASAPRARRSRNSASTARPR